MYDLIQGMVDCLNSGLIYSIPAIGMVLTLRYASFPDLTIEGSFALGASVAMIFAQSNHTFVGITLAVFAGILAGLVTAFVFLVAKTDKLISGIVGMVIAQSTALIIVGSTINVGLEKTIFYYPSIFDDYLKNTLTSGGVLSIEITRLVLLIVIVFVLMAMLARLAHKKFGIAIRALANHADMLSKLGYSRMFYYALILGVSNGIAAFGGAIFANHQKGYDNSFGLNVLVIALVGILLGEEIVKYFTRKKDLTPRGQLLSPIVGSIVYMGFVTIIADITIVTGIAQSSPNLRRLLTAIFLALVLFIQRNKETSNAT